MKNSGIERNLRIAIIVTCAFFIIEVLGGMISNSLSLLSDAGHMLRDLIALLLSYAAVRLAMRSPTRKKTFGYHKVEALAAFLNALLLLGISGFIIIEAVARTSESHIIDTTLMLIVASIGLFANIFIAYTLHGQEDINVKSAYVHVFTDTISSFLVIVGSILISITGKAILDPIISIVIVVIILTSTYPIIKESLRILLDYAPPSINLESILDSIIKIEGVEDVYDVHLWSLCSNVNLFNIHLLVEDGSMINAEDIKSKVRDILFKWGITHSTIEIVPYSKSNENECMICHTIEKKEEEKGKDI